LQFVCERLTQSLTSDDEAGDPTVVSLMDEIHNIVMVRERRFLA
jgi:hypothetical protein